MTIYSLDHDSFKLTIPIEVRFSDLDALGHVNNVTYFTYFEIARISICRPFPVSQYTSTTSRSSSWKRSAATARPPCWATCCTLACASPMRAAALSMSTASAGEATTG